MMCILSATNTSSRYSEDDNARQEEPGIITSVGLPQTPPDSDPGSSPPLNSSDEGECSSDTKKEETPLHFEQIQSAVENDIKEVTSNDEDVTKNAQTLSSQKKDSEDSTKATCHVEDAQGINHLAQPLGEPPNNLKLNQDICNESLYASPSFEGNDQSVKTTSCHQEQKSKILSVELPPTPPTMVDEIHGGQKQRRQRSIKTSKRRLRLSANGKETGHNDTIGENAGSKLENCPGINLTDPCSRLTRLYSEMDASDTSSEEDDEPEEEEKVLDVNPMNNYKRVLVKNGEGGWLLQFVSPCGEYRFNSQKELELNLGRSITPEKEKSPDLKMNKTPSPSDPFAQKLTILRKRLANGLNHFLRQSLDECALRAQRTQTQSKHQNKHLDNTSNNDCISFNNSKQIVNEESQDFKTKTKIAPFTFVNMRQNIFDMTATKRKRMLASQGKSNRGRKCHASKDWIRRNSIAAIHCSSNINLNNTDVTTKSIKGNSAHLTKPLVNANNETDAIKENEKTHPDYNSILYKRLTCKDESYRVCENVVTSIISSCVDEQFSVENRLHLRQHSGIEFGTPKEWKPLPTTVFKPTAINPDSILSKFNANYLPDSSTNNTFNESTSHQSFLQSPEGSDTCNR